LRTLSLMPLKIGSKIPDVTGVLSDGSAWRSADAKGHPLVVYFYPKDFTPGCTREACSFRDAREELVGAHGAEIVGVSRDTPESHARFVEKHRLPFQLVSDVDGRITKAFGATILGGLLPVSKRVTYVADAEGVVRGVFDNMFDAERHVADVRACLDAMATGGSK
jgi:peroxiredoxin Q/BCP